MILHPMDMETRRAREPVHVTVHQPLPNGSQTVTGRLLGEVWARGVLHHYRVSMGGFVLLAPPHWLALESWPAVREAGLTLPEPEKPKRRGRPPGRARVARAAA